MEENVTQIKSGITKNVDVSAKNQKEHHVCKKDYIWNTATCTCGNGEYCASIIPDSEITCDEIIERAKTTPTKSTSAKTVTAKITSTKNTSTNFYIFLTFLLITIALLIAVSIYCYLIKYRSKQKQLLQHYDTSNKLKEINVSNIIKNG